jgi:hypothetical protein
MISKGTCAIAGHLDGPSVVLAGELVTSGMQANVTNEILKYSNLLTNFLMLSQGIFIRFTLVPLANQRDRKT